MRSRAADEAAKAARSLKCPLPLATLQESELVGKGIGVERRLDLEDLHSGLGDEPAHPPVRRVKLGAVLVHEASRGLHRARVVVVTKAAVAREAGGHALVAPVHRHEVDVDVDEQVGRGRTLVQLDVLARARLHRGG